jgi:queuine/archaeosine tRNA-ribosyltransferase
LKSTPHDWAFCYDEFNPPAKLSSMIRAVVRAVERDSHHTSKPVLPIVHAPQTKNGGYNTENVPAAMRQIAVELKPPLIAIPERELGSGIIERAKAVNAIRRELNELGYYQPIHILGTGNPLSIAILTAVGADSFDGLEWCRVAADAATCRLHHFQQYDFFSYQTALASSAIVRDAFQSDRINYAGKVVFHNLDFFKNFIDDLRAAVTDNRATRFLSERLPKGSMEQLEQALPKAF